MFFQMCSIKNLIKHVTFKLSYGVLRLLCVWYIRRLSEYRVYGRRYHDNSQTNKPATCESRLWALCMVWNCPYQLIITLSISLKDLPGGGWHTIHESCL